MHSRHATSPTLPSAASQSPFEASRARSATSPLASSPSSRSSPSSQTSSPSRSRSTSFGRRSSNSGPGPLSFLPEAWLQHMCVFLAADDLLSLSEVCKRWHACSSTDFVWKGRFIAKFGVGALGESKAVASPSGVLYKALFGHQQTMLNALFSKKFADRHCHLAGLKTPLTCMRLFGADRVLINSGRAVRLHDMSEGKCVQNMLHHSAEVLSVSCDKGADLVVSGGMDSAVCVTQASTGELLHELVGHQGPVLSVHLLAARRLVCSGSQDRTLRLWSLDSGECVHVLRHQGDVDHCQLGAVADSASSSSSGAASESAASGPAVVVASASSDQTVRVWNAESGECLWALRVAGFVGGLQLDWPARRLAYIELGGRHTVQLFDAEQRVRLHAFEHANITAMRFDAHKLLTLSPDCLKLFNVQSGALVWSVPKHTSESVLDAAGDKVVCAGSDSNQQLLIYDFSAKHKRGSSRSKSPQRSRSPRGSRSSKCLIC